MKKGFKKAVEWKVHRMISAGKTARTGKSEVPSSDYIKGKGRFNEMSCSGFKSNRDSEAVMWGTARGGYCCTILNFVG